MVFFGKVPKWASMVEGSAEGETRIEALDYAFCNAELGGNLIEVSRVFPKECKLVKLLELPVGSFVPVVMGKITSSVRDDKIGGDEAKEKSKLRAVRMLRN